MPTVIARYGDGGPDYVSGLALEPLDPILAHALYIVETGHDVEWITASVREYTTLEGAMWARTCTELVEAMLHASARAKVWKRAAKRIWTRAVPDTVGRYGNAARDIRYRRHGR